MLHMQTCMPPLLTPPHTRVRMIEEKTSDHPATDVFAVTAVAAA
jgi:hypothetical protein